MPSQFPAFRRTVAERMEAYRERLAERIKRERLKRGESPTDIAYAVGVDKRTYERWEAGDTEPQGRNLRALSEHHDKPITYFRPDLEAEERALQDQLNRLEAKLDALITHFEIKDAPPVMVLAKGPALANGNESPERTPQDEPGQESPAAKPQPRARRTQRS